MIEMINADSHMAELIEQDSFILPFIGRFGIKLNFRDKTVEDICREYNIDVNFFICMLNAYTNPLYLPNLSKCNFKMHDIIEFLHNAHLYFSEVYLNGLGKILEHIFSKSTGCCSDNNNLIQNFFSDYRTEMVSHFETEEKLMFPYISSLELAQQSEADYLRHKRDFLTSSTGVLNDNHNEMEMKISDLKSLIIRYVECKILSTDIYDLVFLAARFEKDMHNHIQIEDRVLLPLARNIEKQIECKYGWK